MLGVLDFTLTFVPWTHCNFEEDPLARIFFSLHAPDYSSISAWFLIRVTFVSGCRKWVIKLSANN